MEWRAPNPGCRFEQLPGHVSGPERPDIDDVELETVFATDVPYNSSLGAILQVGLDLDDGNQQGQNQLILDTELDITTMPNTQANSDSGTYTGTIPPVNVLMAHDISAILDTGASHWRDMVGGSGSRLLDYTQL